MRIGVASGTARTLQVAIVGAGPSGFYAAQALLASATYSRVDIFERLPAPFGLVRYGVAPDHPKTRSVTRVFDRIASNERVVFLGNVTVGRDVSLSEMQLHYDVVILACGLEDPVPLGIPGEGLPGCIPAADFARWYNGHPGYAHRPFALDATAAVIIGHGNVAVDIARILAQPDGVLRTTDMPLYAIDVLRTSRVRDIYLIGRRGPIQARFAAQEIAELSELPGVDLRVDPADLVLDAASQAELEAPGNFQARRTMDVLHTLAGRMPSHPKRIHLCFLRRPVAITGTERVASIRLERNRLAGAPGHLTVAGTNEFDHLACGLVFTSVGHRGRPIPGVPFDPIRGIVPNTQGRVMDGRGPIPGLYVTGWMKRGAYGQIGHDKADSVETVDQILADVPQLPRVPRDASPGVKALLQDRGVRTVSYDDWKRIDAAEMARGAANGKTREKFLSLEEMLEGVDARILST